MSHQLPTHRSEDLNERITSAGAILSGKNIGIYSEYPERQNPNDTGRDISSTKSKHYENANQFKGVRLKDSNSYLKGSGNLITTRSGLNPVKFKSKENILTRRATSGDFKVNDKTEEIHPVTNEDQSESRAIHNVPRIIRPPLRRHRTLPCTPGSFVSDDHLINSRPKYHLESLYSMQQPIAQVTDNSTSLKVTSLDKTASGKTTAKHRLPHSLRQQSFSENTEYIPLQELTVKRPYISDNSSETQYKNTFHEKIRLKHRSKSNEDSDYSDFHLIYPTANKLDHSLDSRKTVAFCAVHSSGSQTGSDNHSYLDISQKTDKDRQSPQNKQFLSPDNYSPMLERSKSVQRLANQSSTETSGLGETVTSGLSSQESIVSFASVAKPANTEHASPQPDLGIDLREDTRNIGTEANSTFGTAIIDSDNIINPTNESKKSNRYRHPSDIIVPCGVNIQVHHTVSSVSEENSHGAAGGRSISPSSDKVTQRQMTSKFMVSSEHLSAKGYKPPLDFRSNDVKKPDNLPMFSSNIGPDFDSLFSQSKTLKVPPSAVGIQLDQINNEWNKHNRGSSIKSRSSQGSFRSRSGSTRRSKRFLAQRESRWMKWGRERRQSFIRRLEKLENPPEPEIPRATTPVKKARQEGLMFIHPDLESKYITEDDINYIKRHKEERLKTCKLIEKSKLKLHHEKHDINRLSSNELMTLSRFWEHRVFVRARYVSILLSVVTIVIYVLSICSTQWVSYPSPEVMEHYAHEGLWYKCRPLQGNNPYSERCDDRAKRAVTGTGEREYESSLWESACLKLDKELQGSTCKDSMTKWQTAVIGLMIFSAAFGFVAAVLAICGVCTSPLPKKIYYFHSAGEIFFVCAMTTTVALIIYAVAISMDANIQHYTFGSGYGLGWGGTAFFFAAALCMSLDDLVRETSQNKCCKKLCWRSRNSDREGSERV